MKLVSFFPRAFARLRFALWGRRLGLGRPIPPAALDHEYESGAWDHFFGPSELPRHEVLLELISSVARHPRVLDLGCGSGRLASLLPPPATSGYLGVDISAAGLARARSLALPHGNFVQASFESWTPETGLFDVIVFNECLGYAPDPLRTARRFAATLRPGGALAVSHFQSSNHIAFWHRLGQHFVFSESRVVTNSTGQVWDVRLLRTRS